MKKLMLLIFVLPMFVLAQEVTDTSKNRIVVTQEVNDCVQTVYNDPNGIKMLITKIGSDKEKMHQIRDEVMSDPKVRRMISDAREQMRGQGGTNDQGNMQNDQNNNMNNNDQNNNMNNNTDQQNNMNNPDSTANMDSQNKTSDYGYGMNNTNSAGTNDVGSCVDKIYDNPDALKLMLSIVLSDREKMQRIRQQVMNDPELRSIINEMHSDNGMNNEGTMHEGENHEEDQNNGTETDSSGVK